MNSFFGIKDEFDVAYGDMLTENIDRNVSVVNCEIVSGNATPEAIKTILDRYVETIGKYLFVPSDFSIEIVDKVEVPEELLTEDDGDILLEVFYDDDTAYITMESGEVVQYDGPTGATVTITAESLGEIMDLQTLEKSIKLDGNGEVSFNIDMELEPSQLVKMADAYNSSIDYASDSYDKDEAASQRTGF